jgi:transposase
MAKTLLADGLWALVEPSCRRSRPSRRAAGHPATTARCSRASCSCSRGLPLAARHTAASLNDSKVLEEMVDTIEPIRRPRGRPRKRPQKLHADKAYDAKKCREVLPKRGIKARIARRGKECSEKLGRYRWWVVERTLSWLNRYRRLKVRYERRADI